MPHVIHESGPARHRQAVALCCDAGYLPYAAFVADRLADLNPQRDFDIVIFSLEHLTLPPALLDKGVRFCRIDGGDAFSDLFVAQHFTLTTYLRLALPEATEQDYGRLLYLDCDIAVQGGDISALLALDMQGHAIGAVRDNLQWRSTTHRPAQFKALRLANMPYFNAGVLLIDNARFVSDRIADRCLTMGREKADLMVAQDQGLLNCVLMGHWLELSPVWNWQYSEKSCLIETQSAVHIVHFIRPVKPWNDHNGQLPPRFTRPVAAYLKLQFPDHPAVPIAQGIMSADRFRSILRRQWLKSFQIARYTGQFPTDLTAISR